MKLGKPSFESPKVEILDPRGRHLLLRTVPIFRKQHLSTQNNSKAVYWFSALRLNLQSKQRTWGHRAECSAAKKSSGKAQIKAMQVEGGWRAGMFLSHCVELRNNVSSP